LVNLTESSLIVIGSSSLSTRSQPPTVISIGIIVTEYPKVALGLKRSSASCKYDRRRQHKSGRQVFVLAFAFFHSHPSIKPLTIVAIEVERTSTVALRRSDPIVVRTPTSQYTLQGNAKNLTLQKLFWPKVITASPLLGILPVSGNIVSCCAWTAGCKKSEAKPTMEKR
jgi:hypothetical protein